MYTAEGASAIILVDYDAVVSRRRRRHKRDNANLGALTKLVRLGRAHEYHMWELGDR